MEKKRRKDEIQRPPDLVTTAWIVRTFGIHQSTIELAWTRNEFDVYAHVAGGNGKFRPIFEKTKAERWAKTRPETARGVAR